MFSNILHFSAVIGYLLFGIIFIVTIDFKFNLELTNCNVAIKAVQGVSQLLKQSGSF